MFNALPAHATCRSQNGYGRRLQRLAAKSVWEMCLRNLRQFALPRGILTPLQI